MVLLRYDSCGALYSPEAIKHQFNSFVTYLKHNSNFMTIVLIH